MKKVTARILLIIIILSLAALACVGGGGGGSTNGAGDAAGGGMLATVSANATAAYGAEQFEIQLTAVAQPGAPAP